MYRRLLTSLLALSPIAALWTGCAGAPQRAADIVTEEVHYRAGGADCTGFLAYDRNREGPRPGVLIVHEWWGHTDYVRVRARMLAELGYTAFALDMYGDGKTAKHPQDAMKFMQEVLANMPAGVERFEAARELLEQHATTDPEQTAAIGYCFGGAIVLAMARRGEDLDAVASFHGSLATEQRAAVDAIKSRVLVCHGRADSMVPIQDVEALEEELVSGGAPYFRVVVYDGAKHGFTNPEATARGKQAGIDIAYDAEADAKSWAALQEFLRDTFE